MIFTMIGQANKHHGELGYIRKHTWWSTLQWLKRHEIYRIIFYHVSRSPTSCKTINSLIPGNIFAFGWDSSVSIHYEQMKGLLYCNPCSLNYCRIHSGEFHSNNLQFKSDGRQLLSGYLSLRFKTLIQVSDLLWDPLNRRRPKLARTTSFINSLDNV